MSACRLAPKKCTPDGLRAAVEEVLGDPKYRANAKRVAERLARAPGPARAAELVEQLAGTRATSASQSQVPAGDR